MNGNRMMALALTVMLLVTGCSGAPSQPPAPSRESSSRAVTSDNGARSQASRPEPAEPPQEAPEADSESSPSSQESRAEGSSKGSSEGSSGSSYSTVRERIKRIKELQEKANSASSKSSSGSSAKADKSSSNSGSSKAPASSSSKADKSSSGAGSSKAPASSSSKADNKPSSSSSSKAPAASSSKPQEEELRVLSTVEGIARLIGAQAGVEQYSHRCVVDVDEGENPYDVTWDYGKLYDAYVEAVDWDLLFDADYYIQTFPGLAHLYHKDKALLLRHFQTVGIHEGRQGCESFNVAAYQKNCDQKLRKTFGDSYECYYLYYAMNQRTQKGVVTTGNEKKQLTVKLTHMQQRELDKINEFRAEVGAAPLEYDPELSALACYRAYIDALEDWDAHDWLHAPENDDTIDGMMEMIDTYRWSENTVHGYQSTKDYALRQGPSSSWYYNYRHSEDHYKAMINVDFHYLGSANCYVSEYERVNPKHPKATAVYIHYDVFVDDLTSPLHG